MANVLCPLDGRYQLQTTPLRNVMGEQSFTSARVRAEREWFKLLSTLGLPQFAKLSAAEEKILFAPLTQTDFDLIYALEHTGYKKMAPTRHDVKAIEYFLRIKLEKTSLKNRLNWLHFALTSEDVNSVAYALLLSDGVEKVLLPTLENLRKTLDKLARKEAHALLLARTHGQAAVPTTFGKEIRVFVSRLARQIQQLKNQQISCKLGGAVGNFNAHYGAFEKINWPKVAQKLVNNLNKNRRIKLFLSPVTTQVDNRDSYAELFDNLRRTHIILLDFCRDMWQYISAGLVAQQAVKGEVGSSTMPQKVNPIDFENAEGNLQLANALLTLFAEKLPVSRLQRDLSCSTVLRNIPVAFGYALVAYTSILKGLSKISFHKQNALAELRSHPEIIAEGLQTILRAEGFLEAYETLKNFTRGKAVTAQLLAEFIDGLNVSAPVKMRLHKLTVENYTGIASKLAEGNND